MGKRSHIEESKKQERTGNKRFLEILQFQLNIVWFRRRIGDGGGLEGLWRSNRSSGDHRLVTLGLLIGHSKRSGRWILKSDVIFKMEGGDTLKCDNREGRLRKSKVGVKQVEKTGHQVKQVEDKWVQVSLASSCRCCFNDDDSSNTMIATMINACCNEDDLIPSVAEYEDIAEVAAALLQEEVALFTDRKIENNNDEGDGSQKPPPLPPRDLGANGVVVEQQQQVRRRKDLRAHLGLKDEEAACLLGVRGALGGRRKDLTRFLGVGTEAANKVKERPKSIMETFLGASRMRRQGMSGSGKDGEHQDQDQVSFQQFVSMLAKEERQIRRAGRVTSRRNPPVRASALFSSSSSSSSSCEESGGEERSSSSSMVSSVAASSCSPASTPTLPSRTLTISRAGMMSMLRSRRSRRREEEEEEVRAAVERGMPVIPFTPLAEGKVARGVAGDLTECGSSSESLDTLIRLAKDQLHSSSFSFSSSSSTSSSSSMEEPIYMEMTGRSPLSISCPPKPCFTDYMDMGVIEKAMSMEKAAFEDKTLVTT